ncbi:CRISPR-associated protein Cas4 [Gluconacetobacter diazotrophicus]|uniref:CRISPR-associated protein Cas4 n=1 Tax=Gluconacetobacter diazotrophicus TaxID=33996 RepID=UPI001E60A851|nr:CRISPR-associated protein Cas4 [Gluconacetobacter diazotrophicus]
MVPISALQHHLFCPRQCALIHVERIWAENGATAEGRILHERVDDGRPDRRTGVRTVRALTIRSLTLGVFGKADAVEFHGVETAAVPYPVEYKRGRPKAHRADEVQLCAQAICLEDMFGHSVPEGALFYGQPRRRTVVVFDGALRTLTEQTARKVRAMIADCLTPPPVYKASCNQCSLQHACQPRRLEKPPSIGRWFATQLLEEDNA